MNHLAKPLYFKPLVIAVNAALALMSFSAGAQTAAPQTEAAQAAADVSVVTVTAQKRKEDIKKVPVAISVVNEFQLENMHVTQLTDLASYLPAVQIHDGGSPGQTTVQMRGVAVLGSSAVVGTYIDDTPVGSSSIYARSAMFALDMLPYDIKRVEVLRGPQGTLYGAGAMGGLLKYVTKDPDLSTFGGRVGGGFASVDGASGQGWDGRAMLNIPLIADELALRASFARNNSPGYLDNAKTGQTGINTSKQESARLAMLWAPTTGLSVKLTALKQTIDARENAMIPADPTTLQPTFGPNTVSNALAGPFEKTLNYYSATLEWDLAWANFVSASSYYKSDTVQTLDLTLTYGPLVPLLTGKPGYTTSSIALGMKKWTQEFRLASKREGSIRWQTGAFFTGESNTNEQAVRAYSTSGELIAGVSPLAAYALPSNYKEGALFGDVTYQFNDRVDLTTGLRYARNEQDFRQSGKGALIPTASTPGASAENVLTYMVSSRYNLSRDSMLYARVASGYRAGGPNVALPNVPPMVKADTLINYEAGAKTQLFDRRLSLDAALYYIDWKDIQVNTSSTAGITYAANGGTAASKGIELTTSFAATRNLRLGFNGAYSDARLTQDAPSFGGKDGDRLPGVPRWSWAASTDYNFVLPSGWNSHVGAAYRWAGDRKMHVDHSPYAYPLASAGTLDMNADVSQGRWTLRAYAKNLTNQDNYISLAPVASAATQKIVQLAATLPRPRTIGLEFDYSF